MQTKGLEMGTVAKVECYSGADCVGGLVVGEGDGTDVDFRRWCGRAGRHVSGLIRLRGEPTLRCRFRQGGTAADELRMTSIVHFVPPAP